MINSILRSIFSYLNLLFLLFILFITNFVNCIDGNGTDHNIFIINEKETSCIKGYIISPWSSFEVDVNCIKFCMNRGCTHCCRSRDTPRNINCLEKAGFFLQGTGEYTRL